MDLEGVTSCCILLTSFHYLSRTTVKMGLESVTICCILQRDESLNTLKAVFTSSSEAKKSDSMRRKLPIFCATGEKPYLVRC